MTVEGRMAANDLDAADGDVAAIMGETFWSLRELSYSFPESADDYQPGGSEAGTYGYGEPTIGFTSATDSFRTAVAQILNDIEALTGLTFLEEAADPGTAVMRFGFTDQTTTGRGYEPGEDDKAGDTWFGTEWGWFEDPEVGDYAWHTILHEIGHALGLEHGHQEGTNGTLSDEMNAMAHTVMTYQSHEDSTVGYYTNESLGFAQSFMQLDVAALQAVYGANYETRSGDTTYRVDGETGLVLADGVAIAGGERVFSTLWDGGGHDTLDLADFDGGTQVRLAGGGEAKFSDEHLAQLDRDVWADANLYFALQAGGDTRALIEAVITGAGDDRATGNQADNTMVLGGGHDIARGNAGNDTLSGRAGADRLLGGAGEDTLLGGGGRDRLKGGREDDRLVGGAGRDKLEGGAGSDTFVFRAGEGADRITDFELGIDRLELSADLAATATLTEQGGDLKVLYEGGSIRLDGVSAEGLSLVDLIA